MNDKDLYNTQYQPGTAWKMVGAERGTRLVPQGGGRQNGRVKTSEGVSRSL